MEQLVLNLNPGSLNLMTEAFCAAYGYLPRVPNAALTRVAPVDGPDLLFWNGEPIDKLPEGYDESEPDPAYTRVRAVDGPDQLFWNGEPIKELPADYTDMVDNSEKPEEFVARKLIEHAENVVATYRVGKEKVKL